MNNIKEKIEQQVGGMIDVKRKEFSRDLETLKEFNVEEILGGINDRFFNGKGEISSIIPKFENDKELYNYDPCKNPCKIQLSVDFAYLNKGLDKANLKISVEVARDERLSGVPKLLLSYDDRDYVDSRLKSDIKKKKDIYICNAGYPNTPSVEEGIMETLIGSLSRFILDDENYPFTELNKNTVDFLENRGVFKEGYIKGMSERCNLSELSNGDKLKG